MKNDDEAYGEMKERVPSLAELSRQHMYGNISTEEYFSLERQLSSPLSQNQTENLGSSHLSEHATIFTNKENKINEKNNREQHAPDSFPSLAELSRQHMYGNISTEEYFSLERQLSSPLSQERVTSVDKSVSRNKIAG